MYSMYNIKNEIENFKRDFNNLKKSIVSNVQINEKTIESDKINYIENNTKECINIVNSIIYSLNK